jgi:hypothetical protein
MKRLIPYIAAAIVLGVLLLIGRHPIEASPPPELPRLVVDVLQFIATFLGVWCARVSLETFKLLRSHGGGQK